MGKVELMLMRGNLSLNESKVLHQTSGNLPRALVRDPLC
jgi:hypothetical protein